MKKKILIIALVCILAGVAAFYIVKVNNMYPQGSVTEYEINEQVELSGYSACVNSYKVMSIDDFMNEYGIDKRKDRSDTQDTRILLRKTKSCLLYTSPSPRD